MPELKRMANIHERLQAAIAKWIEHGRGEQGLLSEYEYLRVSCWLRHSHAGARYKDKEDVKAYMEANRQYYRCGTSVEDVHEYCSGRCGFIYRIENLFLCMECDNNYCGGCREKLSQNAEGDRQCNCGEGIVE